jgi:hypothetical protein
MEGAKAPGQAAAAGAAAGAAGTVLLPGPVLAGPIDAHLRCIETDDHGVTSHAGPLYVTSTSLVLAGKPGMTAPLHDIEEVDVAGHLLLVSLRERRGWVLTVHDPVELRDAIWSAAGRPHGQGSGAAATDEGSPEPRR